MCARSGVRVSVPPNTSALEALGAAGIDVPSSCTEGICGTCETKVLSGSVDHRDFILSDTEKDAGKTMFVCVSPVRYLPRLRSMSSGLGQHEENPMRG